jgi:hypothetical protein
MPSNAELGRLGRSQHLDALRDVMAAVEGQNTVPAVAVLLTGNQDAGHKEFVDFLLGWLRGRRGRSPRRGRPSGERYDLDLLIQWMTEACGLALGHRTVDSIDALAEAIQAGLKDQDLVVVLDQVQRFVGGVARFQSAFWQPLFARLSVLRAAAGTRHRLVLIVANYAASVADDDQAVCGHDHPAAPGHFAKLVPLPCLRAFKQGDVRRWLDDMELPDEPPGRHDELVRIALHSPEDGQFDGTPLRVFARLRSETLWLEEETR